MVMITQFKVSSNGTGFSPEGRRLAIIDSSDITLASNDGGHFQEYIVYPQYMGGLKWKPPKKWKLYLWKSSVSSNPPAPPLIQLRVSKFLPKLKNVKEMFFPRGRECWSGSSPFISLRLDLSWFIVLHNRAPPHHFQKKALCLVTGWR